jgi:hypothetical protein
LLGNGVDIKTMSKRLGRARIPITFDHYASSPPESQERAAPVMSSWLGRTGAGGTGFRPFVTQSASRPAGFAAPGLDFKGFRPRGGTVYTRDLKSLGRQPQHSSQEGTYGKAPDQLSSRLAREAEEHATLDLDLARILDAWPKLPANIKTAMLALIAAGAD